MSFLIAGCGVEAGDSANWGEDFEAAKAMAAEKKLPILADFTGSDWCGWCIKLDREVFSREAFKTFADKSLILFKADFPNRKPQSAAIKKQNEGLQAKYGIRGYPTILLLDAGGNVLAQTGYQPGGAEGYVQHLTDLLKKQEETKPEKKGE